MPSWRGRFHAFIGGVVRTLGGVPLAVGGTFDHVHLLIGLKPVHGVSDFVREVKKASNHWVHHEVRMAAFTWQEGYAVFSVSPGNLGPVTRYIQNQEEHHRVTTFREEFESMLRTAKIEYDPKHLD